ncbi:uncharacterized protein LOC123975383 isoform X1 [Micropterus dolomieu]|uniref:uncharacterized protein LOC123975383 isoform X1 n=1 Tax=Micropterus dolomieu TaxID=147949 RepID=UPI001E8DDE47|nr:uncharacterized protein LOC123975383 isoform X1 [Micropterus dolomieu]
MTLPFFIVFVLQLWTDRTFQRTWTYTCKFFWVLLYHIIKAAFIGLLWVVSVLIDGHWYVCCQNDQSNEQKYLACKAKNEITAVEQQIITELKNESWIIGISLLFGTLCAAALMSSFGKHCFKNSACCNRKNLYLKVILDEEKNVLKEVLTKAAKDDLTKKVENEIRSEQWEGCFDVAKNLIKEDSTRPTLRAAENQEQQQQQRTEQQQQPRRTDPTQPRRPEAVGGNQDIPLLPVTPASLDEQ